MILRIENLRLQICTQHTTQTDLRLMSHRHDLQHLLTRNETVAIEVVHRKGPPQLLLQTASGGDAQGADELPEVNVSVAVRIEGSEDVFGELGGVAVGEKVAVYLLELLHRQNPVRTILEEASIPFFEFSFVEFRVRHEI